MNPAPRLLPILLVLLAVAAPAAAETYPSQPIHVIVPVPAGGSLELLARIIGNKLTEAWHQPVVIENHSGAGGNIAFDMVAKAKPDGYTLLIGWDSLDINPSLFGKVPFDPVADFAPITQTVQTAQVLVVHPASPAHDLASFLELAKSRPQRLSVASAGNGSIGHLTLEALKARAGVELVHVPYRGGAPAANDLVAGHVDALVVSFPAVTQFIRAGKLRALALSSPERSPALPEVPIFAEAGLPGFTVISWQGILAPAKTPPDIIAQLNREIVRILALPEIRQQLIEQGYQPVGSTPEALGALIQRDVIRWTEIVRTSGVKID